MAKRRASSVVAVQPNYAAWDSIQIGMSRDEVIALLGDPPKDRFLTFPPYVCYGWIKFRAAPHPHTYQFILGFDKDGKVLLKSDPFDNKLSMDGTPSKPELIIPQEQARFSHFPRVVDVRWNPCSGAYPMTYEAEVGSAWPGTDNFEDREHSGRLDQPYFSLLFSGSQPGRVRVRARNDLGVSEWSDFRTFDFSPVHFPPRPFRREQSR